MNIKTCFGIVLLLSVFAACTKDDNLKENTLENNKVWLKNKTVADAQKSASAKAVPYKAEYITDARLGSGGKIYYFFNTGNKQLDVAFVPRDPWRGGRIDITYAIDDELTQDNGLNNDEAESAIDAAMATWQAQNCSKLDINKVAYSGNLGWMSTDLGYSGSKDWVADIQHSGFLPLAFFDALIPGGGYSILAVTISYIWIIDGKVIDTDNNGKADLAFSEIYYNDVHDWKTNDGSGYDIETIALHESGHGLGQAHFGKAFYNYKNGKFQVAPKAVMNASYTGEQRTLLGTDKAGHCSIWANWPTN